MSIDHAEPDDVQPNRVGIVRYDTVLRQFMWAGCRSVGVTDGWNCRHGARFHRCVTRISPLFAHQLTFQAIILMEVPVSMKSKSVHPTDVR